MQPLWKCEEVPKGPSWEESFTVLDAENGRKVVKTQGLSFSFHQSLGVPCLQSCQSDRFKWRRGCQLLRSVSMEQFFEHLKETRMSTILFVLKFRQCGMIANQLKQGWFRTSHKDTWLAKASINEAYSCFCKNSGVNRNEVCPEREQMSMVWVAQLLH